MTELLGWRKWLLITGGFVSLGLGILGIFIPLLPTTPFFLLATACFIRSSDRLYRWLITHKLFGAYLRNYREQRAMTRRAKVLTLLLLWAGIGFAILQMAGQTVVQIVLPLIAVSVTLHLLALRTAKAAR